MIIDAAQPAHLARLLMSVYGLTDREQDVTHEVLRGASTATIARKLAITPDTVQQHLTHIFGRTGARSRGELVGLIFQTHYVQRVRDNERRTLSDRGSRDGPMPPHTS